MDKWSDQFKNVKDLTPKILPPLPNHSHQQMKMAKKSRKENAQPQEDNGELELEEEEEEENGELELEKEEEAEVNEMAQKILNYRTTLPDQLNSTLSSTLASQRPVISTHFDSVTESQQPEPSNGLNSDAGRPSGSSNEALGSGEDDDSRKIQLLKDKISSNVETIPIVLKRMKDCMARIDQLESCNRIIHPAFKRKKTS